MNNNYQNNYQNNNYLYNYYNDSNYYNQFNQTNDKRCDLLYDNYINSYQNFDYKIASNIASNYRQCGSGWTPNWGYPQSGQQNQSSYYEPNYAYNRLEPYNSQTNSSVEVESYHNHFPYNEIQNQNYLEKSDKPFESVIKSTFVDNYIPLTVHEVEKQMKTEKDSNDILDNERIDGQMGCTQMSQEVIQIEDISGQTIGYKETDNPDDSDSNLIEMQYISKTQRIRRRNRKQMTYEELKRDKRESNRLAATKCRLKKLKQLESLDKKSKSLVDENNKLEQKLNHMKAEVYEKKLYLIYHRNNGCLINAFGT